MRNSSRLLLTVLAYCFSFSTSAQSDPPSRSLNYFLSVHAGALFGKKGDGPSFTTALIQGLRHKRMSLGIGLGYDVYAEWRTVPLLASLSGDIFYVRGNSVYVQLNGGYSRVWSPDVADNQLYFYDAPNPSFTGEAGYRIRSEKYDLYLSAGYKFQRIRYGWSWQGSHYQTLVRMDVERVSIQIGFGI